MPPCFRMFPSALYVLVMVTHIHSDITEHFMKFVFSLLFTLATLLAGTGIAVAAPTSTAPQTQAVKTAININTADAQTLALNLDGVGTVKAQAIVDYRKANGPFATTADLRKVKGIGERTIEINKANISVQ